MQTHPYIDISIYAFTGNAREQKLYIVILHIVSNTKSYYIELFYTKTFHC